MQMELCRGGSGWRWMRATMQLRMQWSNIELMNAKRGYSTIQFPTDSTNTHDRMPVLIGARVTRGVRSMTKIGPAIGEDKLRR